MEESSNEKVVGLMDEKVIKLSLLAMKFMKTRNILVQYIYTTTGQKCGVVVAVAKDAIGWSSVNMSKDVEKRGGSFHFIENSFNRGALGRRNNCIYEYKEPKFNKWVGLGLAIARADSELDNSNAPSYIKPYIQEMRERARKYFKDEA